MNSRRALFTALLLASAMLARAGVSYDESAVFAFDTREDFSGLAAESATFAFDTRAVDAETTFAHALDDIATKTAISDHDPDAREGVRAFQEKRTPKFNQG